MMKKWLTLPAVLAVGGLLLLRPQEAAQAVREGLALCAGTVIPSLFPFFVVVSLLLQLGLAETLQGLCGPFMGPLFRMRGVCALPLLAGLLGGYPAGARTAAELFQQGRLSRREAELLLGFCDNCGPAFLLGYVGAGVLGDARAGAYLYLIHVLSALLAGMVLCRLCPGRDPALPGGRTAARGVPFPQALTAAGSGAVTATLNICAFVVLFRVLAALLVLEMVTGVSALSPGRAGFVWAGAIVGWGGLSVHCQALSAAAPLSFRWHWAGKALQAALSAAMAYGVFPVAFGG